MVKIFHLIYDKNLTEVLYFGLSLFQYWMTFVLFNCAYKERQIWILKRGEEVLESTAWCKGSA